MENQITLIALDGREHKVIVEHTADYYNISPRSILLNGIDYHNDSTLTNSVSLATILPPTIGNGQSSACRACRNNQPTSSNHVCFPNTTEGIIPKRYYSSKSSVLKKNKASQSFTEGYSLLAAPSTWDVVTNKKDSLKTPKKGSRKKGTPKTVLSSFKNHNKEKVQLSIATLPNDTCESYLKPINYNLSYNESIQEAIVMDLLDKKYGHIIERQLTSEMQRKKGEHNFFSLTNNEESISGNLFDVPIETLIPDSPDENYGLLTSLELQNLPENIFSSQSNLPIKEIKKISQDKNVPDKILSASQKNYPKNIEIQGNKLGYLENKHVPGASNTNSVTCSVQKANTINVASTGEQVESTVEEAYNNIPRSDTQSTRIFCKLPGDSEKLPQKPDLNARLEKKIWEIKPQDINFDIIKDDYSPKPEECSFDEDFYGFSNDSEEQNRAKQNLQQLSSLLELMSKEALTTEQSVNKNINSVKTYLPNNIFKATEEIRNEAVNTPEVTDLPTNIFKAAEDKGHISEETITEEIRNEAVNTPEVTDLPTNIFKAAEDKGHISEETITEEIRNEAVNTPEVTDLPTNIFKAAEDEGHISEETITEEIRNEAVNTPEVGATLEVPQNGCVTENTIMLDKTTNSEYNLTLVRQDSSRTLSRLANSTSEVDIERCDILIVKENGLLEPINGELGKNSKKTDSNSAISKDSEIITSFEEHSYCTKEDKSNERQPSPEVPNPQCQGTENIDPVIDVQLSTEDIFRNTAEEIQCDLGQTISSKNQEDTVSTNRVEKKTSDTSNSATSDRIPRKDLVRTEAELSDLKSRIMAGKINREEILEIIETKNIIQCNITATIVEDSKLAQQKRHAKHVGDCLKKQIEVMKKTFEYLEHIVESSAKLLDGTLTEKDMKNIIGNLQFVKDNVDKTLACCSTKKPKQNGVRYKVINITKKDVNQQNIAAVKGSDAVIKKKKTSKKLLSKTLFRMNKLLEQLEMQNSRCRRTKQNNFVVKLREVAKRDYTRYKQISGNRAKPQVHDTTNDQENISISSQNSSINSYSNDSHSTDSLQAKKPLASIENVIDMSTNESACSKPKITPISLDVKKILWQIEQLNRLGTSEERDITKEIHMKLLEKNTMKTKKPSNAKVAGDKVVNTGRKGETALVESTSKKKKDDNERDFKIKTIGKKNETFKKRRRRKSSNQQNVENHSEAPADSSDSRYSRRSRRPTDFYSSTKYLSKDESSKPKVDVDFSNLRGKPNKRAASTNVMFEITNSNKPVVVLYDKRDKSLPISAMKLEKHDTGKILMKLSPHEAELSNKETAKTDTSKISSEVGEETEKVQRARKLASNKSKIEMPVKTVAETEEENTKRLLRPRSTKTVVEKRQLRSNSSVGDKSAVKKK